MRRRDFITLLGGAAAGWPLAARGQQAALPLVGFLSSAALEGLEPYLSAFQQGLHETGLFERRNVIIEYLWADNENDRLHALAAELVRRQTNVIVAPSIAAALAAKSATSTIPIVFYTGADPVNLGLVTSRSRPNGNLTGVTGLGSELEQKRLSCCTSLFRRRQSLLFWSTRTILFLPSRQ